MQKPDIFHRVARRYRSIAQPGASVLVAVSGGADSTALLFLLHALKRRCAIRRLGVLHVNHGLRGRDSDGDERFVASLSRRLRMPFFLKTLSGRSLHQPGMEAWARGERYRFFLEVKDRERYDCIATGHTADDQAETVLFRIMRGAGLRGLRGILAKRDDGVIRPIIDLRREEIVAWLGRQGMAFRHDSSNDDRSFQRNRMRFEVLPALEGREPGSRRLLLRIAEKTQGIWIRAQPRIGKWVSSFVKRGDAGFIVDKAGLADPFHSSEGLRMLFDHYGIPTDSPHIDEVIKNTARTGREYLLPGGQWRYFPRRDTLVFSRGPLADAATFSFALAVPGTTECPGCGVRFIAVEKAAPMGEISKDNLTVMLDREACGTRLVYRNWRPRDVFVPFGSRRRTGVGPFLAKQKLGKGERKALGVVEGRDGAVVWIPGVRLSELVRVTPTTKRVLKISYQSCPII
ncbi:MAG: tRNA lysidine(34) synthetase TilS [Chitinispirillaceae bacterium]|nr:tRNA lysidine(34) synthetase TilS [Chitinispirillaceae bacterium]